jgi:hypothetical protein
METINKMIEQHEQLNKARKIKVIILFIGWLFMTALIFLA